MDNVFTMTELANKTKTVCQTATDEGVAYISSNGRVLYRIEDVSRFRTLDDMVRDTRNRRSLERFNEIWAEYADVPAMTLEEINAEIAAARRERRERKAAENA